MYANMSSLSSCSLAVKRQLCTMDSRRVGAKVHNREPSCRRIISLSCIMCKSKPLRGDRPLLRVANAFLYRTTWTAVSCSKFQQIPAAAAGLLGAREPGISSGYCQPLNIYAHPPKSLCNLQQTPTRTTPGIRVAGDSTRHVRLFLRSQS